MIITKMDKNSNRRPEAMSIFNGHACHLLNQDLGIESGRYNETLFECKFPAPYYFFILFGQPLRCPLYA